jgi:hypothetical protein
MPVIAIHQVKPGMVLESPVTNFLGNTILKPGISLTKDHIVTLKTWGIKTITVRGEDHHETLCQSTDSNGVQEKIEKLDRMFSFVKDQPGMSMIYEIVRKQTLKAPR